MRNLVAVIISLMSISCATIDVDAYPTYVDFRLKPYIELFRYEAARHDVDVTVEHVSALFNTIGGDPAGAITLGMCELTWSRGIITIDGEHWERLPELTREELMFHELGHCVLRRGHCDPKDGEARFSIMDSYIGSPENYGRNRDAYVEELFHADVRCSEPGRDSD